MSNFLSIAENDLEKKILQDEAFQMGLSWGKPRKGHPEGKIHLHIQEVLQNVDFFTKKSPELRDDLRLITLVHDTFKYKECTMSPRNWDQHHAVIARKFLAQHTDRQDLLTIVETHDDLYYAWRKGIKSPELGKKRLEILLGKIEDHLKLYYLFFLCDTLTGDKTKEPIKWFEKMEPAVLQYSPF